ncbi:MAG: CPBP family intramembrane metalloprotease [Verrucomicrobiota bacterium]|nr:CPBP family intramembrane metalloprotease [Verrucomicrobiota bacterium]
MLSDSAVTAIGVVFYIVLLLAGGYIYVSLIRQISAGRSTSFDTPVKTFGLPEAVLAALLISLLLLNVGASFSRPSTDISSGSLLSSLVVTLGVVIFIAGLLTLRGLSLEALAGFSRLGIVRAITTGMILLFAAYPLISLADVITQHLLGSGSSRQNIVELFNSSRTIQQRIIIIVFAVTVAPIAEEFIFRFFLYGVVKRYFGRFFGIVFTAMLFAVVHTHLPSFAALFVLGSCFAIAYEWSGSILVSMTMHSFFNALNLIFLAFPHTFEQ